MRLSETTTRVSVMFHTNRDASDTARTQIHYGEIEFDRCLRVPRLHESLTRSMRGLPPPGSVRNNRIGRGEPRCPSLGAPRPHLISGSFVWYDMTICVSPKQQPVCRFGSTQTVMYWGQHGHRPFRCVLVL
jgi:hypothetical protein